jgi:hypothetical protein
MGAPIPKLEPVDNGTAEALLSSLQGITGGERRKHASVFNYWLSIRGDRQLPPIRDLDPLEISDAGPSSVLLELIGTEDAVIRHLGQAIKLGLDIEMIARAPDPSLLACIREKLPAVASSMQALAFEDSFETANGTTRCWVTLLPFSANGTWIDYVYGFVSLAAGDASQSDEVQQPVEELESSQVPLGPLDDEPETAEAASPTEDTAPEEVEPQPETEAGLEPALEAQLEAEPEVVAEDEPEPVLETEPEAEPDLEVVAELDADLETGPATEPDAIEPDLEPLASIELEAEPVPEPAPEPEPEPEAMLPAEPESELEAMLPAQPEPELLTDQEEDVAPAKAGFSSKLFGSLASVGGFYGRVVHAATDTPVDEPTYEEAAVPTEELTSDDVAEPPEELAAEDVNMPVDDSAPEDFGEMVEAPVETDVAQQVTEPICQTEGTLQSKLTDVRAMAEEARQAQLRSNLALYAGLSAAYDFALDAEDEPEEYLRLVEGQGLKIQLRSPMKPVVKLAFAETCDAATIGQLEAVLAWALKNDLPRGSLAERIEAEGGIGPILEGLGLAA